MTLIDPTMPMLWCGRQTYGNVPAASKVCKNSAPGISVPESNAPVSDVTVCGL